jgi:hypothetical protein
LAARYDGTDESGTVHPGAGTKRAPLVDADVFPKTESGHLSTWAGST